ncbi:hypothetical protein PybrP1_000444 [[Pythium] brassicae (nom. inval.)]|nr:hypothetical protein PybrP1_000444 [[Pythium] brassicae (nom. inval.)]
MVSLSMVPLGVVRCTVESVSATPWLTVLTHSLGRRRCAEGPKGNGIYTRGAGAPLPPLSPCLHLSHSPLRSLAQPFARRRQRVCADELARCVRRLEAQFAERLVEWKAEVATALARLDGEISAAREETLEIVEAVRGEQAVRWACADRENEGGVPSTEQVCACANVAQSAVRAIHDRLAALDEHAARKEQEVSKSENLVNELAEQRAADRVNSVPNTQVRGTSNGVSMNEPQDGAADASGDAMENPCTSSQKLVSGPKMDVSGFASLNAAAFVLQHCRFDRQGVAGIIDAATGAIERYSALYRNVQLVSAGLRERGFRPGSAMRFSTQSTSLPLLVLALSVWNLFGTTELSDLAGDDVESTVRRDGAANRSACWQRAWLVCDSVSDVQQQRAQTRWKPEQTVVVHPGWQGSSSSELISYEDLLSTQTPGAIAIGQYAVRVEAVSEACIRDRQLRFDPRWWCSFRCLRTASQCDFGAAVAKNAATLDLLNPSGAHDIVLNCLPFSHSACLTVGFLPAIMLGVSVLPAWLSGGDHELAAHFASHECHRRPLPARPALRVPDVAKLALWRPSLRTLRRSTDASAASLTAKSGGLETGAALPPPSVVGRNAGRDVRDRGSPRADPQKSAAAAPRTRSAASHGGLQREEAGGVRKGLGHLRTRFEHTVQGQAADSHRGLRHGVVGAREAPRASVQHCRSPSRPQSSRTKQCDGLDTLPIEELVASHPLVADAAILCGDCAETPNDSRSLLTVCVALAPGARKYSDDSLATITSFLAKKLPSDASVVGRLELVDCIPRDVYGRVLSETLAESTSRDGNEGERQV